MIYKKKLYQILGLAISTWAILTVFLLFLPAVYAQSAENSATLTLMEGTQIGLATTQEITSKQAHKGQIVQLVTTEDIFVDGLQVIAKGSIATAQISNLWQKGIGQAGSVEITPLFISVDGQNIRLKGAGVRVDASVNAAATVLEIMTALPFTRKQGQATVPVGTVLTAYTMRAVTFPKASAQAAAQ
jgi:hypothetical protein